MGTEIGNPLEHIAVLFLLNGMYAVFHVGIVQRNGAAKCLGVVSSAARSAGVYPKAGVAENNLVPKLVISLNVEVFDCTDSVLGLVEFPGGTGVIVEILTVDVNARLLDYLVNALGHPFKGLGIGIVEENVGVIGIGAAEQPLGMVLIEPCACHNALGLKPKQQLNAVLFAFLADGSKAVGEVCLVDFPCADERPLVVSADIPACINPPNVGFNALFNVGTDTSELVFLGGSGKLGEAVGVENVHTKLGRKGVSVGILNADVFHKETSPHISSVSLVSHIAFKVDAGSSHNLAGIEHHMAALLTEGYFYAAFNLLKFCDPGTGPAYGNVDAAGAAVQSHKGRCAGAGTAGVVWMKHKGSLQVVFKIFVTHIASVVAVGIGQGNIVVGFDNACADAEVGKNF